MSEVPTTSLGAPWYRAIWARRRDYDWQPSRWLAAGAVVLAAAVYAVTAWSARYPTIPLDELVMVGNSRVIAGLPGDWPLSGAGFMPGLAVLMAPAWWFTSSAVVVYQIGIWITVALALLAIWPLSAIAHRVGVSRPAGVIVSAVVVMAPARSLLSNFLLAESALLVSTAALVVAADRLWTRHGTADALWFGAAVGAAVLSHGRGVGTAVAAGLWTLLMLRRDAKHAILAGGSALLAAIGAYVLYQAVAGEVIGSDARVGTAFGDLAGRDLGASVASAIGQLWYPTLAWPAVAVIGGMAVVWWGRKGGMAALVVLGIAVGLVLSTVQLNPNAGAVRMDLWFYGRYMDQWWTILAVVGLAVLVRVKWPAMSAMALGAAVVSGIGMLLVTVPSMPGGMRWIDLHVLGITPWLSLDSYAEGEPQPWTRIVLTGLALTVLVLALGLMRVWVLPILATLWVGLSIAQDSQGIDIRSGDRIPESEVTGVELLPAGSTIGIDQDLGSRANTLVFAADSQAVVKVDALAPPDGIDVVYVSWFQANDSPPGVRILKPTVGRWLVAWVRPGALADRLDAEGLLVDPAS